MQFSKIFLALAAATFAAAAALPAEGAAPAEIFKRADACGEGRPCKGVLNLDARDAACSKQCKNSCGYRYGQCGGLGWQTCKCVE
ncbi:hypothetical protein BJ508DRAFT_324643 [Ascobolus immersus RN42]|uniref:Invertebrate defensins family profile domain-containing protein n=1 Tax=Ascobolus immersus RN42 TaxID=1160509 RepID=A0A3N4ID02_ASCIM|nr:hypothetical protein BJ508DRAFT_324643 [Ascobolus immersus RN42]